MLSESGLFEASECKFTRLEVFEAAPVELPFKSLEYSTRSLQMKKVFCELAENLRGGGEPADRLEPNEGEAVREAAAVPRLEAAKTS